MTAIEIRERAIHFAQNEFKFSDVDWDPVLDQLEGAIVNFHGYPHAQFPIEQASSLIDRLIHNGEFMVALVFSPDHNHVTALPIRDVYDRQNRINLSSLGRSTENDMKSISDIVFGILDHQPRPNRALNNVILLSQNLAWRRYEEGLFIGNWNTQKAKKDPNTSTYDSWIRATLHDMKSEG